MVKETQTIKNLSAQFQALGSKQNFKLQIVYENVGNEIRGDTIWEEIDVECRAKRSR